MHHLHVSFLNGIPDLNVIDFVLLSALILKQKIGIMNKEIFKTWQVEEIMHAHIWSCYSLLIYAAN